MENLFNDTQTHTTANESLSAVDLLVIEKMAGNINGKIIKEIAFSDKESRIKELHYNAFKKLPKPEKPIPYGGIPIIEDEKVPDNMFVIRYENPIYNQVFMLVDDKLMDLGSMQQFFNKPSHFSL